MKKQEFLAIIIAIVVLTAVYGFSLALDSNWASLPLVFLSAVIIILVSVFSKKLIAYMLDSDVEHETWKIYRFGWKPSQHFKNQFSAGIIIPLVITLITLGILKLSAVLTYETSALKTRAAKRFGAYSFTEMTDWHNSLIGAFGIICVLIVAVVTYFLPADLEYMAKMATFYAFWNMLPISNLDGTQIFFGSRILYSVLTIITLIFTFYAVVL